MFFRFFALCFFILACTSVDKPLILYKCWVNKEGLNKGSKVKCVRARASDPVCQQRSTQKSFCISSSSDQILITNCTVSKKGMLSCVREPALMPFSLKFKAEQILSPKTSTNPLVVGGLSSLFYDSSTGWFYALSDDKKDHRIYRLSLQSSPEYRFEILDSLLLKSPGENRLKRNMDPEAMGLYGETLLIASEGQQIFKEHEPTQILNFKWSDLTFQSAWPVPEMFWSKGAKIQTGKLGQKENKGFESLSLNLSAQTLWTVTEKPLYQDDKLQVLRLTEFDLKTQKILSQYLYPFPDQNRGLTALHFLKDKQFLALERTFVNLVFSAHLYLVNCDKAVDVKSEVILKKLDYSYCSKKKLWSSRELDFPVDNLEGLALVPVKDLQKNKNSTKKLLILVSDSNFKKVQENQVLFFEVMGL